MRRHPKTASHPPSLPAGPAITISADGTVTGLEAAARALSRDPYAVRCWSNFAAMGEPDGSATGMSEAVNSNEVINHESDATQSDATKVCRSTPP